MATSQTAGSGDEKFQPVGIQRTRALKTVRQVLLMQTLFGVTLALMTLLISADFAVSTLLGALIGVVPNAYLALRIFGKEPSVEVQTLASRIYVGETLKIILTIALFVVVMKLFAANVVGVLAGYLATFVANWVALLVVDLSETT